MRINSPERPKTTKPYVVLSPQQLKQKKREEHQQKLELQRQQEIELKKQKDEEELDAKNSTETYDVQEVEAEGGLPGMDQHNPPPQPKYLTVEERRNKESGYIRPIRTRRK